MGLLIITMRILSKEQQPALYRGASARFFRWNRTIALLIFLYGMPCAKAQETHLILTGKIADHRTKAPIAYASIGITGKGVGTVSNEYGDFELFLPASFIHDSLFVSHLGYTTFHGTVAALRSHPGIIYLKEAAVMLQDVVVTDKALNAAAIIQLVKKNVKNNYPVHEYKADAFFREIRKENDVYKSLLEAAVTIYDGGYHKPRSAEKVYLQEMRTSKKYMNEFNADFWNGSNLFKAVLSLNALRHPDAQSDLFDRKTNYRLTEISQYMDKPVYVLVSDTSKDNAWQRKIYVDTVTYAIYRSDAVYLPNAQTWKVNDQDSVAAQMTFGKSIQDYKIVQGRLFLGYIMHHVENVYFNTNTKAVIKRFTIQQYLLVNDTQLSNLPVPDPALLMKDHSLQAQVKKYNPVFWKNYNSIKSTPLERKILEDLERDKSLEEQFVDPENQHTKKGKNE